MTTTPATLIRELRELHAKATPGPWHIDHAASGGGNVQSPRGPVARTTWFGNTHAEAMRDYVNGELIIAAVNAIPTLLDEIERLTAERDAAARETFEEAARIAEERAPVVQCMSVEPIVEACTDIATAIRQRADERGR